MTIGIDGNEANVKNRVGSSQYAFELLKQFAKIANYSLGEEQNGKSRSLKISSRQDRTLKFDVYLKDQALPDLPKEAPNFKYKVFGPKKLWTQFALPIKLTFGPRPNIFFSTAHYGPRYSKVPYVVTIHDLSYLHYPELFKKDDLLQLTMWSKYSIENSAHIITPSKATKDDIVKNYKVNPSKITVTYEGYDQSRFKPQPKSKIDKVKKRYKIMGDYIIFVGTLQPRKNIEHLIEAFSQIIYKTTPGVGSDSPGVRNDFGKLQLVICGKKGWLYDSIFDKVKQLNLEKKIIFTDFVPDEDLPALISGAKVYGLPSLWEGFGIPVIEAQACGIPVVVSNTSSLPEIVGESGILVDPEDVNSITAGIKKVLTSETTRSDLIKKGFENIKRFSWRKCGQETLKILENTAKKRQYP